MRVIVVAKDNTDYSRQVATFVDDMARQTGHELEVLDPESREGESFCRAYDIVEYPTILAIADDGHLLQMWRGRPLPLIDEVAYYAR